MTFDSGRHNWCRQVSLGDFLDALSLELDTKREDVAASDSVSASHFQGSVELDGGNGPFKW